MENFLFSPPSLFRKTNIIELNLYAGISGMIKRHTEMWRKRENSDGPEYKGRINFKYHVCI